MNILTHELSNHLRFREQLRAEFPDVDEETLQDMLEGLTDLREMVCALIRSQLDDRMLVDALGSRIAAMQVRLGRLEARIERKRLLAASVMTDAGISKITEPDFTASVRPGRPPLIITDEAQIPEKY